MKAKRGGPGRGQGRKPLKAGEKTVSISFRGTEAQRDRFKALGSGKWVRYILDSAKWPKAPADREAAQSEGKHPAPCARFCEANAFEIEIRQIRRENERLKAAINQTLDENGHLADGDDCTLIVLKRAVGEENETR